MTNVRYLRSMLAKRTVGLRPESAKGRGRAPAKRLWLAERYWRNRKLPAAGASRSRVYELMKSRDVEFVKVGSSTLILMQSLGRFMESRRD